MVVCRAKQVQTVMHQAAAAVTCTCEPQVPASGPQHKYAGYQTSDDLFVDDFLNIRSCRCTDILLAQLCSGTPSKLCTAYLTHVRKTYMES